MRFSIKASNRIVFPLEMLAAVLALAIPAAGADEGVDFNRDIRPILSDKCYACHGPDPEQRQADLRLDVELPTNDDVLMPGNAAESMLVERIFTDQDDALMPPPDSGKSLTDQQKQLLRRWIEQGAGYDRHWAFIAPHSPEAPSVKTADWGNNPIDTFVLAQLETNGLEPSPEADKAVLLRRICLDLTGLPPTPDEVSAFVNDTSSDAYEKVVDRLLQTDRYAERMAASWLDAARYADTNGYQNDRGRTMWRWRDWVIDAYRTNMPYDQFVLEQVAGDMLENATIEQRIATGFGRNHRINGEGGVIPEEYRVEYVVDRVETLGTVFLGMTLGCARCHSHKFDPISQREFYKLFAYFNNVPEKGRDGEGGNAVPKLDVGVPQMQQELDAAQAKVKRIEQQFAADTDDYVHERQSWIEQQHALANQTAQQSMWQPVELIDAQATNELKLQRQDDGSLLATGANPARSDYTVTIKSPPGKLTGIRLETLTDRTMTQNGLARSVNGNFVLTDFRVSTKRPDENSAKPVGIQSAIAEYSQNQYPIAHAIDKNQKSGWAVLGREKLVNTSAVFRFAKPVTISDDTEIIVELVHASQYASHGIGRFRLSTTSAAQPAIQGAGDLPPQVLAAVRVPSDQQTQAQREAIDKYFRTLSKTLAPIGQQLETARKQLQATQAKATTSVMVMQEMDAPRQTFMLNRGQYDQPGEEVTPGIPAALGKLPQGAPNNRLGLAQWLVDDNNPLTARVAVNRYWQQFFGAGLVRTVDDFGAQGETPSHPQLLDWLATEFVHSDWDVRHIQKMIAMSATYRQCSDTPAERLKRDPENRLLSRGPRFRLRGMFIRDQALFVSGLLVEKVGGPSVQPYQPASLWQQVSAKQRFVLGTGDDLYRRSMYTYWKRTVPPPSMAIFNESSRDFCNVVRRETNTPLQALTTMNDVQFVEASRFLAQRMLLEGGKRPEDQVRYGWQLVLARTPDAVESQRLIAAYQQYREHYQKHPSDAQQLLSSGSSPTDPQLDQATHAAMTMIASVILNLDETIVKR